MTPNLRASGYVRAVKSDRVVSFRSSTPDLDRHGTRILPRGINTENYRKNPVFLWGHDGYGGLMGGPSLDSIIGRTISYSVTDDGFDHEVEFADTESADKALRLVKGGFLNATSIGFSPIEGRWHEEKSASANTPPVIVFDEVELLEVSLVPIPSNPNAQALARAMTVQGFDVEAWVRSAVVATPSEHDHHPNPETTPSESRESEGTPSDPLLDLIANITVEPYRPSVGSQVLRAVSQIRRPSWR